MPLYMQPAKPDHQDLRDFHVIETASGGRMRAVGRIYWDAHRPKETSWVWRLERGGHEDPHQGYAANQILAMAAIKERWNPDGKRRAGAARSAGPRPASVRSREATVRRVEA
jgi:hypothetical protein